VTKLLTSQSSAMPVTSGYL